MRSSFRQRRALLSSVAAVALLSILSCGPAARRVEPTNLDWPLPPDPPRIHYVESIYKEDDIGRVYSLKEKLFGKVYVDTLNRPYGVFARRSRILVSDIGNNAVFIFDLTAKRMSLLSGEGLTRPAGAVETADGSVYVVDAGASKIVKFSANGKYETAWRWDLSRPVSIALNEALGRLYIVDHAAHAVVVASLDGKKLFSFGARGNADGKFNKPVDIAIGRDGKVYVLDAGNFRVQIFTPEGVFLSKFGSVGDRPGLFANPKGIGVDSEGHVYVSDAAFGNFQIFDSRGDSLLAVGDLGAAPGKFHLPGGISVDENDRIYVCDQLNGRIEVFQYLKGSEPERKP